MSKKKNDKPNLEVVENKPEPLARMSPEQYWRWRATTLEINVADAQMKATQVELQGMRLEVENRQLKLHLAIKTRLAGAQSAVDNCKQEYEKELEKLEKELGVTMKDKVINEAFEVFEAPKKTEGEN